MWEGASWYIVGDSPGEPARWVARVKTTLRVPWAVLQMKVMVYVPVKVDGDTFTMGEPNVVSVSSPTPVSTVMQGCKGLTSAAQPVRVRLVVPR